MRLEVHVLVDAPREMVWELLTCWERQPEWMLDAKAVEVLTPRREGVGVTLRCPTALFGVTVDDVMRVTVWDAPVRLEVEHLGRVITGRGAFVLTEVDATTTRIDWWEEVAPPLGVVGERVATAVVLPVLRRIFTRSLRNLARMAEGRADA